VKNTLAYNLHKEYIVTTRDLLPKEDVMENMNRIKEEDLPCIRCLLVELYLSHFCLCSKKRKETCLLHPASRLGITSKKSNATSNGQKRRWLIGVFPQYNVVTSYGEHEVTPPTHHGLLAIFIGVDISRLVHPA
jgi:hypothetical protein